MKNYKRQIELIKEVRKTLGKDIEAPIYIEEMNMIDLNDIEDEEDM